MRLQITLSTTTVFPYLFPSGSERFTTIQANEIGAIGSFLRPPEHRADRTAGDI